MARRRIAVPGGNEFVAERRRSRSDPDPTTTGYNRSDLGPTLRKAYSQPHQEHLGFFALGGVRNAFVILALEHYSWTTVLFPAAVGVSYAVVALFL